MNRITPSRLRTFVLIPLACLILAMLAAPAALAKKKLPETMDGLNLVPDTKAYAVYMKPGVSLEKYDQAKILDCYVQFVAHYQQNFNMDAIGLGGMVTTKDMDDIKQWLSAEFTKVFTEQLQKNGQTVVDTTGPNVLLLRPAIINLDVTSPDLDRPAMVNNYVASAGSMTLYMELYDSATSELLARIIDPEAGQEGGMAFEANRVTNEAEADEILRHWADLLSAHMGELSQKSAGQAAD